MPQPPVRPYPGIQIVEAPAGSQPISGVSTAVAAFLGWTAAPPNDDSSQFGRAFLVTDWTQFQRMFGGHASYTTQVNGNQEECQLMLPIAVEGYFNNGGNVCYIESLGALPVASQPIREARLSGRTAGSFSLLIEPKVNDEVIVTVSDQPEVADQPKPGDDVFRLEVRTSSGQSEPVFENLTFSKSKDARNVAAVINRESRLIKVSELPNNAPMNERRPAVGAYKIPAALQTGQAMSKTKTPEPKAAPEVPKTAEMHGALEDRTGIGALEAIEEITMVCMPDLMEWQRMGKLTLEDVVSIQKALVDHCEKKKDRMAILDTPFGMKVQEVRNWRKGEDKYANNPAGLNVDSAFAALYYPWITVQKPFPGKGQMMIPPSGHIAGLYGRVDATRGVHKAPANEVLRGALALELDVNNEEQGLLNPFGINCIRTFPGRGIRVWGARTLSSDANWNYVNVRRLFNYVEESIFEGMQWAVFEPNDMDLWERVKRTITAFLTGVWRTGALFGTTPEEAFYVKCDAELNPASERNKGNLFVEVGMAPVRPAEFIVIQFKQWDGGGEVSE